MRKAILFLIFKLLLIGVLSSCDPSAEEKALMEKAGVAQDPGIKTKIRIRFASGAIDTINYNIRGKIQLRAEDLYDHFETSESDALIAHHVDAFSIIE